MEKYPQGLTITKKNVALVSDLMMGLGGQWPRDWVLVSMLPFWMPYGPPLETGSGRQGSGWLWEHQGPLL